MTPLPADQLRWIEEAQRLLLSLGTPAWPEYPYFSAADEATLEDAPSRGSRSKGSLLRDPPEKLWIEQVLDPVRHLAGTDHVYYVGPRLRAMALPLERHRGELPLAKLPLAKLPLAKLPLAKLPLAKLPLAKLPLAKLPLAKLPLAKLASSDETPLGDETPSKETLVVCSPSGGDAFAGEIAGQLTGYRDGFMQLKDPYATFLHAVAHSAGAAALHDGFVHDPKNPLRKQSVVYQEIYRPVGIERHMALTVPLPRGEAMLLCGYSEAKLPAAGGPEHTALQLLLPAFEAGLHFRRHMGDAMAQWAASLDALPGPFAVLDATGDEVYRNRALRRLLASEPEAGALARALGAFGRSLSPPLSAQPFAGSSFAVSPFANEKSTVTLKGGRYRLRGSIDREAPGGPFLLVSVERAQAVPPARLFQERFGLTAREAEVAQLLAKGYADKEVAERLFVSPHTARRHAERVLKKMGLSSRAGILYQCLKTGAWE